MAPWMTTEYGSADMRFAGSSAQLEGLLEEVAIIIVTSLEKIVQANDNDPTAHKLSEEDVLAEANKANEYLNSFPQFASPHAARISEIKFEELPIQVQDRLNPNILTKAQLRIEPARQQALARLRAILEPVS